MKACKHCGKDNFDDAKGCKRPVVYSPGVGDWICTRGDSTKVIKVTRTT